MSEELMCEGCECIAGHLDDCPTGDRGYPPKEILADVFLTAQFMIVDPDTAAVTSVWTRTDYLGEIAHG